MTRNRPEPIVSERHVELANRVQATYVSGTYNEQEFLVLSSIRYDPSLDTHFEAHIPEAVAYLPSKRHTSTNGALSSSSFLLFDQHVKRLNFSLQYFHWDYVLTPQMLLDELDTALAHHDRSQPLMVRLMIDNAGKVLVATLATPVRTNLLAGLSGKATWDVCIDKAPTDISPFTSLKTTKRDHYNASRLANGIELGLTREVIIYNSANFVMECSISNLAVWRTRDGSEAGRWVTPPLVSGGICGTMRSWLLEHGVVEERPVRVGELRDGEELLMFNAVMGVVRGTLRVER